MTRPLYFDYMATTPIDPRVIERMLEVMGPDADFGNPASIQHPYGQQAAQHVDHAREQIANVIGATPDALVFTSGATESINLALLGGARFYQRKGRHLITMTTEHKAVLDTLAHLETEGFEVTRLPPMSDGLLNLDDLAHALRPDTVLVSIMHVNNEIGVIQDIEAIGALLRGKGILFHVDAAQSAGKLPIDVCAMQVDLMSFSAHKNYGPKGVGALYVRQKPRIRLQAQSFGGGQEHGLRSGTLPTHQIVGIGAAFALGETLRVAEQQRLLQLRTHLWQNLEDLPGIQLHGHAVTRVAGNLNFSLEGIDGALLLPALHELALSTQSACAAASGHPSYVLRSLGISEQRARSALRLSLGRFTTDDDIKRAITVLREQLPALRRLVIK